MYMVTSGTRRQPSRGLPLRGSVSGRGNGEGEGKGRCMALSQGLARNRKLLVIMMPSGWFPSTREPGTRLSQGRKTTPPGQPRCPCRTDGDNLFPSVTKTHAPEVLGSAPHLVIFPFLPGERWGREVEPSLWPEGCSAGGAGSPETLPSPAQALSSQQSMAY